MDEEKNNYTKPPVLVNSPKLVAIIVVSVLFVFGLICICVAAQQPVYVQTTGTVYAVNRHDSVTDVFATFQINDKEYTATLFNAADEYSLDDAVVIEYALGKPSDNRIVEQMADNND